MNYIPIKQAAKVAHVSRQTLYRWRTMGLIDSRCFHQRGIEVALESVMMLSTRKDWPLPKAPPRQLGLWEVAS